MRQKGRSQVSQLDDPRPLCKSIALFRPISLVATERSDRRAVGRRSSHRVQRKRHPEAGKGGSNMLELLKGAQGAQGYQISRSSFRVDGGGQATD